MYDLQELMVVGWLIWFAMIVFGVLLGAIIVRLLD